MTKKEIELLQLQPGEKILIYTHHKKGPYVGDFHAVSDDLLEWKTGTGTQGKGLEEVSTIEKIKKDPSAEIL